MSGDVTDEGDIRLSESERRAVASLQRLASRWPSSLTLASMGGTLVVVHSDDPRFDSENAAERNDAALAYVEGIPNTGGDW